MAPSMSKVMQVGVEANFYHQSLCNLKISKIGSIIIYA